MTNHTKVPLLTDLGSASKATHGDSHPWPWYEMSAPPFNHYCPIC
jgi:hypothetical protein